MPGLDGTGPLGRGPLTGRGLGSCLSGLGKTLKNTSRGTKILSFIVPAMSAVVMDARKTDGLTRRLYHTVRNKLTGTSPIREIPNSRTKIIDENDKNPKKIHGKK